MNGKFHENCFVCGKHSENGLGLKFILHDDDTLSGEFKVSKEYQGYDGILHGGIITTILDSSMIHLFYMKDGIELKTVKLNIRFMRPIPVEETITVKATADGDTRHFYKARAQIMLSGKVFVEAEGYFRNSQ